MACLCKQLGVARSGFYSWRQRQCNPGPRAQENAALTAQVQEVFERHRVASTAHHTSIKRSEPRASRWAATALRG
jgi:hypothetical protein